MAIAGYAIGAQTGIVYLRAEYAYLNAMLESVLEKRRQDGLLGKGILGKADFDFDIPGPRGGTQGDRPHRAAARAANRERSRSNPTSA